MQLPRWRSWIDWVYPNACTLCSRLLVHTQEHTLCNACRSEMIPIENACERCGAPLPATAIETTAQRIDPAHAATSGRHARGRKEKKRPPTCTFCENRKWEFSRVYSYTVYRDASVRAARFMKEPNYEPLTRCIGTIIGNWLASYPLSPHLQLLDFAPLDLVVPIPQYWIRRFLHRYNQSEVLAEQVAACIGRPMAPFALGRCRWTQKQGMKTIEERRQNMRQVFVVRNRTAIANRRVLLVDDVMTSGATLNDAARALRAAGASSVHAVVFARGVNAHRVEPRGPTAESLTSTNQKIQ
jgi:predicted amidophosphoribosyltransferase